MSKAVSPRQIAPCADCACFNIRKASRVVTQIYDEVMHETGLRGTQFTILANIAGYQRITISVLAEKLVMDRTTLTRNLKPLNKQGLIEIVPGEDRRTRAIELTAEGHAVLAEALPLWREAQKRVTQFMGKSRLTHLIAELRSLEKMVDKS
ncbi:MAG: winged helix-turn-helix transcriptional regulator [Gammaproteobacteria bacterium]|nr:winged helix-turn-helix transcriptional regulator [Gammaproteobacteria bacterium]